MEKLMVLLNSYLQAASHVITKYTPSVWHATLHLIQASSIFDLVMRLLGTLALIAIPITLSRLLQPEAEHDEYKFDKSDKKLAIVLVSAAVAVVSFIIWANSFTDWLGAFCPQLYLLYAVALKAGLMLP